MIKSSSQDRVELKPTPEQRFWAKVVKSDGCWFWTGHTAKTGYGFFTPTHGARNEGAHRYAYEALVGPIPAGLELDHLCKVTNCVNPAHLEPVTHRVNTLRSNNPAALNARKTHCPKGHDFTLRKSGYRYCAVCQVAKRRVSNALARKGRQHG